MQSSPLPTSPLLRLSPEIRHRIYHHLDLASWDGRHPYAYKVRGKRRPHSPESECDTPDPSSFHGLLLTCRAIHAEAAALLYSANRFFVWYASRHHRSHSGSGSGLHFLHALTTLAFRSLSSVKVVLNQSSCHEFDRDADCEPCCFQGRGGHIGLQGTGQCHCARWTLEEPPRTIKAHDPPLVLESADAVVRDWCSAAAYFLSGVTPGRLSLSLVCDIDPRHPRASRLAELVMEPILRLPSGHLRECNIRLSMVPDSRLRKIAKDAACHACGLLPDPPPPPPDGRPTLTALPRELRLRILEYTDLVTPSRQVMWGRKDPIYRVFSFPFSNLATADENHRAQFFCCWEVEDAPAGLPLAPGCFCRLRHAAFSHACKCWEPPGPSLFLICRTLYEDAQYVFFSKNRFSIHDYRMSWPWGLPSEDSVENGPPPEYYPYPYERFAVSHFLREVVPASSLAHIRSLELVFPHYFPGSWPGTHHPAIQDWHATIDWLRPRIRTRRLTLQLAVAHLDGHIENDPPITTQGVQELLNVYMDLVQPLARLADDGLARFYAHIPHPWRWTDEFRHYDSWDRTENVRLNREERALKERLERCVLGSRHDSLHADGVEEPNLGDWNEGYWW
ncbi:hypothetical protein VTH82DRAFT_5485 [Thermothelomyces myriococcoides]